MKYNLYQISASQYDLPLYVRPRRNLITCFLHFNYLLELGPYKYPSNLSTLLWQLVAHKDIIKWVQDKFIQLEPYI